VTTSDPSGDQFPVLGTTESNKKATAKGTARDKPLQEQQQEQNNGSSSSSNSSNSGSGSNSSGSTQKQQHLPTSPGTPPDDDGQPTKAARPPV